MIRKFAIQLDVNLVRCDKVLSWLVYDTFPQQLICFWFVSSIANSSPAGVTQHLTPNHDLLSPGFCKYKSFSLTLAMIFLLCRCTRKHFQANHFVTCLESDPFIRRQLLRTFFTLLNDEWQQQQQKKAKEIVSVFCSCWMHTCQKEKTIALEEDDELLEVVALKESVESIRRASSYVTASGSWLDPDTIESRGKGPGQHPCNRENRRGKLYI